MSIPTVVTTAVGGVTAYSANLSGDVISDNGSAVTARGNAYGFTANPTIGVDQITIVGAGTGPFTAAGVALATGGTYHTRAYATNAFGTAYGANVTFATPVAGADLGVMGEWTLACMFDTGGVTEQFDITPDTKVLISLNNGYYGNRATGNGNYASGAVVPDAATPAPLDPGPAEQTAFNATVLSLLPDTFPTGTRHYTELFPTPGSTFTSGNHEITATVPFPPGTYTLDTSGGYIIFYASHTTPTIESETFFTMAAGSDPGMVFWYVSKNLQLQTNGTFASDPAIIGYGCIVGDADAGPSGKLLVKPLNAGIVWHGSIVTSTFLDINAVSTFGTTVFPHTPQCVTGDALVEIAGGARVRVDSLARGDLVATADGALPLARLIRSPVAAAAGAVLVEIKPGALAPGVPAEAVRCSAAHPLMVDGVWTEAVCLLGRTGGVSRVAPAATDAFLYNLQFEVETAVRLGGNVLFHAESPHSVHSALAPHLFFDASLRRVERTRFLLHPSAAVVAGGWRTAGGLYRHVPGPHVLGNDWALSESESETAAVAPGVGLL
jgi:hypothetical protein